MRPSATKPVEKDSVRMNRNHCGSQGPVVIKEIKIKAKIRGMRSGFIACIPYFSYLPRLGEAEETSRAEGEHHRHHEIDHEKLEVRREMHGHRAHDPDD